MSKPVSTIPSGWISLINRRSVFFHVFFFTEKVTFATKQEAFSFSDQKSNMETLKISKVMHFKEERFLVWISLGEFFD